MNGEIYANQEKSNTDGFWWFESSLCGRKSSQSVDDGNCWFNQFILFLYINNGSDLFVVVVVVVVVVVHKQHLY